MSGHDNDDIRNGDTNTGNDNRVDGLEFFHPDWNKYFELSNKPFDEFTQSEQTFFRRMYLWEEMGWATQCERCSEDD